MMKPFELLKLVQGRRRSDGTGEDWKYGILSDATGSMNMSANPNVAGQSGKVWVRFPAGSDGGVQQYFPPVAIWEGIGAAFIKKGGRAVWVGVDPRGEPEVKQGDRLDLKQINITPAVTNPLNREGQSQNRANPFLPLLAEPVNTPSTPGWLVTVYPLWYDTGSAIKFYPGTEALADKVDLVLLKPDAGEYCYAMLWLDTATNALETPSSSTETVKTSGSPTNAQIITAIEECYAAKPNANCIPIKAFYLDGDASSLIQLARHIDFRQMVNMIAGGGSGMTDFIAAGDTGTPQTISNGNTLSLLGGTGLSSVASATDTVTMNLDDTAVTPGSYTLASITVDQQGRLTAASNGSAGTMTDFDVAADSGTPATIEDSDELEIAGDGLNIETSIAAKVVTIALKQEAVVKLCDLRMTHDIELPYYADITDEDELLCAPIKSGMVTLPVSGLWRYFEVAGITTPIEAANTETGDVASGSAVITNMSFTRSLAPGMTLSGTGINAAATISTVDSATQITMSHTGTATNAGVTLTFEFPADQVYDVFLVYDSGLAAVVPFYRKWQMASLRSAMSQVNGIWLSDADTDARWIGAIRVPTNQLFQKSPLQCFISNLDHPFPHRLRVTDTTDSWSYSGGWRQARATTTNKVEFIAAMWNFTYSFKLVSYASGAASRIGYAGIGLNSTSAPAAESIGRQGNYSSAAHEPAISFLEGAALAGHNSIVWLEQSTGGSLFFYGDQGQTDGMQSGLSGWVMS